LSLALQPERRRRYISGMTLPASESPEALNRESAAEGPLPDDDARDYRMPHDRAFGDALESSNPELKRRIDLAERAIEIAALPSASEVQRLGEPLRNAVRASIVECDVAIEQRKAFGTIPLTKAKRDEIKDQRKALVSALRWFRKVDPRLMAEWGLAKFDFSDPNNVDFVSAVDAAIRRMQRTLDDYDKRPRTTKRPDTIDGEECARAAMNFLHRLGRSFKPGDQQVLMLACAYAGIEFSTGKRETRMRDVCAKIFEQDSRLLPNRPRKGKWRAGALPLAAKASTESPTKSGN
jgi:hypothetical protein